jgi:hypothetical protein
MEKVCKRGTGHVNPLISVRRSRARGPHSSLRFHRKQCSSSNLKDLMTIFEIINKAESVPVYHETINST